MGAGEGRYSGVSEIKISENTKIPRFKLQFFGKLCYSYIPIPVFLYRKPNLVTNQEIVKCLSQIEKL